MSAADDPCYAAARTAGVPLRDAPAHALEAGVCSGCGLIPCPVPEADDAGGYCDADLYVELSGSVPVVETEDTTLPITFDGAVTRTWRVVCPQGHVILLPPDTADSSYDYEHGDHVRLLSLVARLRGAE